LTVGVPYEIIAIENSNGKLSICEAYNQGASQSQYNVLCFMHEDILIHTTDWGKIVVNTLKDETIGLIGVAGGTVKLKAPSSWWTLCLDSPTQTNNPFVRRNIIQHYPIDNRVVAERENPKEELISDVVDVDGVWFCCRKEVWRQNKFDEKTFREFHFYDLDFSLQIFQQSRVCVIYTILIEHLSPGSQNESWIDNAIKFSDKWASQLPVSIQLLKKEEIKQLEIENYRAFLTKVIQDHYRRELPLRFFLRYFLLNPLDNLNWYFSKWLARAYFPNGYHFVKGFFKS
jgi:hypothetical protein